MSDSGLKARTTRFNNAFQRLMGTQIDPASLAMFRIFLGCAMIFECWFYLSPTSEGSSIATLFFVEPELNFSYQFFPWVRPLPAPWIYLHILLIGVTGLLVALGCFYRTAITSLAVLFTWFFLLEESLYLNHFYLMSLLCWMMTLMPADRCWSVDQWRRDRVRQPDSPSTIPFWPVFLLRAMMFIVYFYAGIAKLHTDWLIGSTILPQGSQLCGLLREFFSLSPTQAPLLTPQACSLFLSWGGLVFDLSIGFLLIFRRTRFLALALALGFHGTNHFMFNIGVFPFLAFGATLLFCEPDWPRALARWIRRPTLAKGNRRWMLGGLATVPIVGGLLGWKARVGGWTSRHEQVKTPILAFVLLWLTVHVTVPFRHYLIPGDANWTTEAHRFSWRMMLYRKRGTTHIDIVDKELLVDDSDGKTRMQWDKWPNNRDRVTHVETNSDTVVWSDMPEMLVTFEPILGYRFIWNPRSDVGDEQLSTDELRSQIESYWQEKYGRKPTITRCTNLVATIRTLRNTLKQQRIDRTEDGRTLLRLLAGNLESATNLNHPECPPPIREMMLIELNDDLQSYTVAGDYAEVVRQHLANLGPFELINGSHSPTAFTIHDDELLKINERGYANVAWSEWKSRPQVFIDFSKIRYFAFINLPQVMVCERGEQTRIEWNHRVQLRPRQVERLSVRPYLAHQYSQHIAQEWQDEFGQEPEVYVTSYVALNHHQPQLLLDPQTDLASATLKPFGRNSWALRLEESREAAKRNQPILQPQQQFTDAPKRQRGDLRDGQLVNNVTRWYAEGQKMEEREYVIQAGYERGTLTGWYPDGTLRMRAPFVNGQHHGLVRKWHANGQLAIEAEYDRGTKHGIARIWTERGEQKAEMTFVDGKQSSKAATVANRNSEDRFR